MTSERIDLAFGELRNSIVDLIRHVENRAWAALYNFLTGNSILVLAWATLYTLNPEREGIVFILVPLAFMGILGGIAWALLGARNWEYVRELVKKRRALEAMTWNADIPENHRLSALEDLVHSRWGRLFPISYQSVILSATPICFSLLYLILLTVAVWSYTPPIVLCILWVAALIILGVVITRCRESIKDSEAQGQK